MTGASGDRLAALDGLRGWAALSVVIYHCVWGPYEKVTTETLNFVTALLGNGILAVGLFLTISGYVLTRKRWRNPANPPLHVAFIRRYVRLTIPIVAATALVFVLMTLDLTPTRAAHRITLATDWYGHFLRFEPHLLDAVAFAFGWTYTWPVARNYNPFLWTMVAELWGCLALFVLSQGNRFQREPYSPLMLLATIALLTFPLAACFIVGALLALAERDGVLRAESTPLTSFLASTALIALPIIAALVLLDDRHVRWLSILGTGIFVAARYSVPAQSFLALPVSQFVGRISFPLYLVQFAVIVSLSAHLIIAANAAGVLTTTVAYLIAAASVLASLALATVLLPVELGTLALLRRFSRPLRAPLVPSAAKVAG